MKIYDSFRGRAFRVNCEYPIYDGADNIIGHTAATDIIVITYDESKSDVQKCVIGTGDGVGDFEVRDIEHGDYLEATVATGKFAGYDGLALNVSDIKKAIYIGDGTDTDIFVRDIKLR